MQNKEKHEFFGTKLEGLQKHDILFLFLYWVSLKKN